MADINQEPQTDEELIRLFQAGDERAYEQIVERYSRQLCSFIYRIVNDWTLSQDVLQDTFVRLYLNKDSYREIARFSTWIYTIAGNLAKTELRRQKVRRWTSLSSRDDDQRPIEIADGGELPSETAQRSGVRERIDEEIQKLPSVFKKAIILRDVQELSYEEISTILKVPLGTVKSRVNRGRARLQEQLKDLRKI